MSSRVNWRATTTHHVGMDMLLFLYVMIGVGGNNPHMMRDMIHMVAHRDRWKALNINYSFASN